MPSFQGPRLAYQLERREEYPARLLVSGGLRQSRTMMWGTGSSWPWFFAGVVPLAVGGVRTVYCVDGAQEFAHNLAYPLRRDIL